MIDSDYIIKENLLKFELKHKNLKEINEKIEILE